MGNWPRVCSFFRNWKVLMLVLCTFLVSQYSKNDLLSTVQSTVQSAEPFLEIDTDHCSYVHVAVSCIGHRPTRWLSTLVKSILFYRSRPIHLHLITDDDSKKILTNLFNTWNIPQVETSFYSHSSLPQMPVMKNSDPFEYWKLGIVEILPLWIDKVIAMDVDSIVDDDVAELWSQFFTMSPIEAIGMVPTQANVTSVMNSVDTNSIGPLYEYDLGVVLFDLKKLRTAKRWQNVLEQVTETLLVENSTTKLIESNVMKAAVFKEPSIIHTLPCEWNVQSSNFMTKTCFENIVKFKLITDWSEHLEKREYSDSSNLYFGFQAFDGNMLRRPIFHCIEPKIADESEVDKQGDPACQELRSLGKIRFRTHIYYLGFGTVSNDTNDVTWVSQLSLDRIHMVELLCAAWEGPISLAFYLSDGEADKLVNFITKSEILSKRDNIIYHVVFSQGSQHPINYLRNVAMDYVRTPFVFLSDIDFLPGPKQYNTLKRHIQTSGVSQGKKALVVPAFETFQRDFKIPYTKENLTQMLNKHELFVFKADKYPRGHAPTNFAKWKISSKPYFVDWAWGFEPYIVVRSDVVRYDLRFSGYFWNKISHSVELNAQHYRFQVLPDTYVIHLVHANSPDMYRYQTSLTDRKCNEIIRREFLSFIKKRYNISDPLKKSSK